MVTAAKLSKTGGMRLLATCTRTAGAGSVVPHLLVSTSYPTNKSPGAAERVSWTIKPHNKLINNATLSSLTKTATFSTTRLYCTALSVPEDSPAATISSATITSAPSSSTSTDEESTVQIKDVANTLEIKVGKILRAWRHEEADSLYVEEVDVGEAEPRIICSGLVKYIPLEFLQEKKVVVLANLKARNMRGVKSNGMLMAASDESHENVELLMPPEDSVPGERVWFGSEDEFTELPDPASPNQIQKKKIWESVQPHLKTDASGVASLEGLHIMRTSTGIVSSPSLKNANIS